MSELFDKSLRTLELPRVLQMLSEQAVSAEAKQRAMAVRPETEREEVERLLDQTDAARTMIGLRGSPSFSGVKPVAESLDRADRGGSLNTRELLTIADLLTAARRAKEYFNADAAEKTAIDHLFLSLHGNRFLEEKIKRCIVDEDTIADAASPELADIRRHMRAAQTKSRQILQKIISSPSYAKVLQETIITQRDGRFVVPVKAEHKGDLPGLVHDISSSGATVFVEPMGVVQANNEFIELQAKEEKEIQRILAELSAEAAAHREDIQWDYDAMVHLDLIFARGQLSYKMNAARPALRRDGGIHLRRARHPLLDPKKAVPIDIQLGDTFDTLVITGPNTGGKTVSLKTLGLLTVMTQCGLHIPVADQSEISVYEKVLADIGDEQSIEQSLSTFSAHMVNIVSILQEADRRSLILFDELGAGTDPVEGAALAIAIIQEARSAGAKIAATTHYAELKTFAMTTAGVENASCEFDVETLSPTYRLLIGIPGKSNAFAISRRLGLPEKVIQAAQVQMSGESVRFEDVLTELEAKRQALEKREQEADRLYAPAGRGRPQGPGVPGPDGAGQGERPQPGRGGGQADRAGCPFRRRPGVRGAERHAQGPGQGGAQHERERGSGGPPPHPQRGGRGHLQAGCPAGAHPQAQPSHRRGRSGGDPRRADAGGGGVRGQGRHAAAEVRRAEDEGQGRRGAAHRGRRAGGPQAQERRHHPPECRPCTADRRVPGAGYPGTGDTGGGGRCGKLPLCRCHGPSGHGDHHPRQGYRRTAQGRPRYPAAQ